jgi:membrane protease YdiL (CAAX protease family)
MPLKTIVFSILAIAFAFLFPHTGLAPMFSYIIPVLLLIWLVLKNTKENFSSIGFSFNHFTTKAIVIGTIAGILLFCFLNYVFFPLLTKIIPLQPASLGGFKSIRHNTSMYIFILAMGWLVGGWYEEIVFHGFIFTRIEKMVGGKYAVLVSVLLTGIIFSLYHFQLGASGMINAFIAGLGYQLVMLRFKRNIWYSFFAHGIFDTIGITFIYLGYW